MVSINAIIFIKVQYNAYLTPLETPEVNTLLPLFYKWENWAQRIITELESCCGLNVFPSKLKTYTLKPNS